MAEIFLIAKKDAIVWPSGPVLEVKPVVSVDRRAVQIEFWGQYRGQNKKKPLEVESVEFKATVSIPDKTTLLFRVPIAKFRLLDVREEKDATGKAKLKFVEKKISPSEPSGYLYILVKPKIITGEPVPQENKPVAEDAELQKKLISWVEKFFSRNYRDVKNRKTLEWGDPKKLADGNYSIRYKYKCSIWDKEQMIGNEIFTFTPAGKYVSAKKVKGYPQWPDRKTPAPQRHGGLVSGKLLRESVSLDVPDTLQIKRNDLLSKAGSHIRKGLIDLAKQFPQFKKSTQWTHILRPLENSPDRLEIRLYHHTQKSGPDPMPQRDRFHITLTIVPPPPPKARVFMKPLYPNLGLVGEISVWGGNPELDAALKKLVAEALVPLKELNDKSSPKPTAQEAGSKLEFRIAANPFVMDKAEVASYRNWLKEGRVGFWWKDGRITGIAGRMLDHAWLPIADELTKSPVLVTGKYKGQTYVLVSDKPGETMLQGKGDNAWGLTRVYATTDSLARPSVGFEFDQRGAKLFSTFTKTNVKNVIAIVIDGKVISAPTLMSPMSNQAMITGKFSKQQVAAMIKALKIGMPPASPPVKKATFGPVIERVINHTGENCMIDFDTGKLVTPPAFADGPKSAVKWIEDHGIDAGGGAPAGLIAFDFIALPSSNSSWKKLTPDGLGNYDDLAFKFSKPGSPIYLSAKGDLPVTYIFKTREGGIGILQILEVKTAKPRYIKIRYKMLQRPGEAKKLTTPLPVASGRSETPLAGGTCQ